MKALLVWEQMPFKRVHDIAELVALVPEAKRPSLPLSAQDRLTHYAVASRYPDEEPPLGREEAVAALQAAREIRHAVGTWLPLDALPPFPST